MKNKLNCLNSRPNLYGFSVTLQDEIKKTIERKNRIFFMSFVQ
jgi:hypothetical protein